MVYSKLVLTLLLFLSFYLVNAQGTSERKFIYLTFDDGPLDGSQKIDDAIRYEEIPITVLLVGSHAEKYPEYVNLYHSNEHIELGNHSYSHARNHYSKFYFDPHGVLEDFMRNHEIFEFPDKVARLPGRNMWRIGERRKDDIASGSEAADLLANNGFQIYGWDMEWFHDPKTGEPVGKAEEIFGEIKSHLNNHRTFTRNHVVILCHDEMFRTDYEETELKKLIELIKQEPEYAFARLKDYPQGSDKE